MEARYQRFLQGMSAERIVQSLQTCQHLRPHQAVGAAVERVRDEVGFCVESAQRALGALGIEPQRSIGRLRSTELSQLARTIERLWRQNLRSAAPV